MTIIGQKFNVKKSVIEREACKNFACKRKKEEFLTMNEDLNAILEYYWANLDDSGEPDEAPEFEGLVTLPTPDEERQNRLEWKQKVASWTNEGSENLWFRQKLRNTEMNSSKNYAMQWKTEQPRGKGREQTGTRLLMQLAAVHITELTR